MKVYSKADGLKKVKSMQKTSGAKIYKVTKTKTKLYGTNPVTIYNLHTKNKNHSTNSNPYGLDMMKGAYLIPVEESTFNAGMWAFGGDEEEAPIYGNTIPRSTRYKFSNGEPIPNWNYNPSATVHQGPEIMYFDVNGDGVLNVTDIVTVVNHILDPNYSMSPEGLERLNTYSLDGTTGDGIVNVADIVAVVEIIFTPYHD